MDITNNFEDDDYRLGSFFIGDLTPKRRELTASFTIRETASALWRQATYGLNTATGPQGTSTKQSAGHHDHQLHQHSGGTPTTPYSMTITIPNFVLEPFAFAVSGDDIIDDDISGRGLRPLSGYPAGDGRRQDRLATIS
jgi:hypothetical protein